VAAGVAGGVGAALGDDESVPVMDGVAAAEPEPEADAVELDEGVAGGDVVAVAVASAEEDADAPAESVSVADAVAADDGEPLTGEGLGDTLREGDTLGDTLPLGDELGHDNAAREKLLARAGTLLSRTNVASVRLKVSSACRIMPVSQEEQHESTRPHKLTLPRLKPGAPRS
jgi:hypothetical protein